jgi:Fe2+ transport system protein FeoA
VTLAELAPERVAAIVKIDGPRGLCRRLLAMGFLPGAPVRIVQVAPFGDPLTVDLDGWRVSLRRSEASLLEVREAAP